MRKRLRLPLKRLRKRLAPYGAPQQRDRRALAAADVTPLLRKFGSDRPRGAIRPDWSDLHYLYRLVRERAPDVLLELGSGCSTVVLAAALRDNGHGHLWSVDVDAEWATATEQGLPAPLRKLVTIVRSHTIEDDRDVLGWTHANLPDISPDFLYLDSPPLTRERQVAFDPLDLERRFAPGFVMVVDGRYRNARYLSEHLLRAYRVTAMPGRTIIELSE